MNLLTHFLGFLDPFTSFLSLIVPMGLLLNFLGFLDLFTSSLPFIILVGLLTIIPAILACWACFTIFSSHFFHIVGFVLLLGLLSNVGINIVYWDPYCSPACSCTIFFFFWSLACLLNKFKIKVQIWFVYKEQTWTNFLSSCLNSLTYFQHYIFFFFFEKEHKQTTHTQRE